MITAIPSLIPSLKLVFALLKEMFSELAETIPLFNHTGKICVKAFDSYSSLHTVQVREQVGEAEHEMCCYANNTYLSPGMKREAGTGITTLYMYACTESLCH